MEIIDPLDIYPKETRRLLLQKSRLFGDIPSQPIHSPLAAWVHQTPTHGDTSCQLFSTLEIFLPFLRERGRGNFPPSLWTFVFDISKCYRRAIFMNFWIFLCFLKQTKWFPGVVWFVSDWLQYTLLHQVPGVDSKAGRSLRAFKESARHRNIGLRWKRNQCSHAPWLLVVQNYWRSH